MSQLKNLIRIHPLTIAFFIAIFFTPYKSRFFILYFFVFIHELFHSLTALLLKEKIRAVHLLPFGCMLSLSSVPSRKKSLLIFLSGPLFNLSMFLFNIFPQENLSLALFNLIPVVPLDGGMIISLLFPKFSFVISLASIFLISAACVFFKRFYSLPLMLLVILSVTEKNKLENNINSRIITYFSVEKKAKKLYNTIDKL